MGKMKELGIASEDQVIIGTVEVKIRHNKALFDKFNTGNKIKDFKPEDIVKCSFMKGLFKVAGPALFDEDRLSLYPIDYTGEFTNISPEFLRKVEVNDKLIKVLYEG